SYDPDGNYFLDRGADDECYYDCGNWADEWCDAHPGECESCDCAHSHYSGDQAGHTTYESCEQKGKACWWMMARLAGWDPGTSGTTTVGPSTTTTAGTDTTTTTTTEDGSICPSEAIYGEYSKETELLRYVRDNVLSATPEGRELIKLYYEWSPFVVKLMGKDEEFKEEVKAVVDGILQLTEVE
ncbi:MAG: hypothetical protein JRI49_01485, partial [Deltaproteobacteria bacterium]|nr:hypothetical protein [Deltaproteobacteria bacterium]